MQNAWTGIYILMALIGLTFILLLASFFPKNSIQFTDLPTDGEPQPVINSDSPVLGDITSGIGFWQKTNENKVIIIHYGNYSCNSCVRTAKALRDVYEEYPDDIAIVWKDLPNPTIDIESLNAAVAARCAQNQDRFWEYQEYLLDNYLRAGDELYNEIATELNLGSWRFSSCYEKQKTIDLVESDYEEALNLGLTAAPSTYINGEWYTGELTEAEIMSILLNITSTSN